jgi:hypothetical protein
VFLYLCMQAHPTNTTDTGATPLPTAKLQSEQPTATLQAWRPMKRPATLVKALQMQEHQHACTSEPPDILLTSPPTIHNKEY